MAEDQKTRERLFAGVNPGGISWADRTVHEHGDYKQLAFLPFSTLELSVKADCPAELAEIIREDATQFQNKRGERFKVSTCGQTVILGQL